MSRQQGHSALIIVVIVLAVAIIGLLGFLFWKNFLHKPVADSSSITSFAECKAALGSKLLETYPEQCVTLDGKSFTAPTEEEATEELQTYCAPAEKICFEYPLDWKVVQVPQDGPGDSVTDAFVVQSSDASAKLSFTSGIGGIGGACSEESYVPVYVLPSTDIAKMTGFQDEYSLDMLKVARVIVEQEAGQFVASIYATDEAEYSQQGVLDTCGVMFSHLMNGRNARISTDYEGAGAFLFGMIGADAGSTTFATLAEAKEAYNTKPYVQAAAILASMRYQ